MDYSMEASHVYTHTQRSCAPDTICTCTNESGVSASSDWLLYTGACDLVQVLCRERFSVPHVHERCSSNGVLEELRVHTQL